MDKIIMLGVGGGITTNLFNTCFVIQNDSGNFLVDAGGSIEILSRLKKVGIDFRQIRHIFISHSHTDHLLGLIWYFKLVSLSYLQDNLKENINIYCSSDVKEAIINISKYVFPKKLIDVLFPFINFVVLNDKDTHKINGNNYTFFNTHAKETTLFGFECNINNKKFVFLGDETPNSVLYPRLINADIVMHEAYCLDSQEGIPQIVKEHHATVKKVCQNLLFCCIFKLLSVINPAHFESESSRCAQCLRIVILSHDRMSQILKMHIRLKKQ